MPNKLKVHSNERIDLVDYVLGANDYTASTAAFINEKTLLDNRPRVLEGFYIEVSDQSVAPGQITVFNGFALNREGTPINDESLANSSVTVTLSGASQSFYVEIQFVESDSDTDSRAFWDPTVVNSSPIPSGGEVSVNTSTRITPNWRIVSPISTTGFEITSNPNSTKVPIALLNTDVSNQITGAVNTYGALVNASTKAEQDVIATAGSVRVIDSKLFAIGSQFTYDFGGTNPETVRTVNANDLDNNIITFTPGLTFAHSAGAIIRQTGVTARYLPQTLDPSDPTFTATLPTARPNDQVLRMWQGNEVRGSAFLASKSTFGARNDLDIRTLKDEVDFLAAIVRDLKFGNPRPDITSAAPPSAFAARPRWFDAAGGVTGARTASVSIGNGTTTFGDFNGTSQATFIAAELALPSSGGTIFVKPGTYVFTSAWSLTKANVQLIGDNKTTCIIQNNNAAPCVSVAASKVLATKHLSFVTGTGSVNSISLNASTLFTEQCEHTGITCTSSSIVSQYSDFNEIITATSLVNGLFTDSNFTTNSGIVGALNNTYISNCVFTTTNTAISCTSDSDNLNVTDTIITTSASTRSISTTAEISNCTFSNVIISGTNSGGNSIVHIGDEATAVVFDKCRISGNMTATSAVSYGNLIGILNNANRITIQNCQLSATGTYTNGVFRGTGGSTATINVIGNTILATIGVNLAIGGSGGTVNVHDNLIAAVGGTVDTAGVFVGNITAKVSIVGNTINASGSATKRGVYAAGTGALLDVSVVNNFFDVYSTTLSYCVFITSTNNDTLARVVGNKCTATANTAGNWYGVYVDNVISEVMSNTVNNVTKTSTGIIVGVFCAPYPSTIRAQISNNTFSSLTTNNGIIVATTATVGTALDYLQITDNDISDISVGGSGASGSLIYVADDPVAPATIYSVIKGNTFNNCVLGTAAAFAYGIRLNGEGSVIGNTLNSLSAPSCTGLFAIDVTSTVMAEISHNNISNVTVTTPGSDVYGINSTSSVVNITNNTITSITSTTSQAIAIGLGPTGSGICKGNTLQNIFGTTNTYGIYTGSASDLLVSDNRFDTNNVTGNVYNTYFTTGNGFTVSKNTFLSSTQTGVDVYVPGILNNVNICDNQFKSICEANVKIIVPSNTSISGNVLINNNVFDCGSANITTHTPVQVEVFAGASGGFGPMTIAGNTIYRAASTTARGIYVTGWSLGAFSMGGISILNNQIQETGGLLTTAAPISVAAITSGTITDVIIKGNIIGMNAIAGARLGLSLGGTGIDRLVFSDNVMFRDSGANSCVTFSNVTNFVISGNLIESNTSTAVFEGGTGPSTFGTIIGNTVVLTGGGVIETGFTSDVVTGNRT